MSKQLPQIWKGFWGWTFPSTGCPKRRIFDKESGKVLENCHGEMANGGLVIIGSMGSDVVKRERESVCVCCVLLHVSTSIIITIIIMTIVSRMYKFTSNV